MSVDLLSAGGKFVLEPVDDSPKLTVKLSDKLINIFDVNSKLTTATGDEFHIPSQVLGMHYPTSPGRQQRSLVERLASDIR